MAGRTTKAKRIFFSFLILIAFGVVPLTIAYNHGVTIHIEIVEPHGEIHYGDRIRLRCNVDGVDSYFLSWQCLRVTDDNDDTLSWEDLNFHDDEYEFILTKENVGYLYRVIVSTDIATYSTSSAETTTPTPSTGEYPSEEPEAVETLRVSEELEQR